MKKYIEKSKKLIESNFRIYGVGNFDLELEEYALILKYLDEEDFDSLLQLYEKLEKQRMG